MLRLGNFVVLLLGAVLAFGMVAVTFNTIRLQILTQREEIEVARLIGDGLTNAEIANTLGIAPKTASSHVEHILAKLGASRRAEIATWASHVRARPGQPQPPQVEQPTRV
jgi:DNA-binding CsgD family transcriptional regulator